MNEAKFKVGDKVKIMKIIVEPDTPNESRKRLEDMYIGKLGVIHSAKRDEGLYPYTVRFDDDIPNDGFREEELGGKSTQLTIE